MAESPVIVIVPGSFANAPLYYPFITQFENRGYRAYVHNLPSASRNPPEEPATLEEDAVFFSTRIEKLAAEGKNIVILTHSYGGVVGTEACKGLSKTDRQATGKLGGVIKLIYWTSVVPPEGGSLASINAAPLPKFIESEQTGFLRIVDFEACARISFSDWDVKTGVQLARSFNRQSAISFAGQITYAAYKYIPVTYILCETDQLVVLERQRQQIARIKEATGKQVDVRTIKSGHCPTDTIVEKIVQIVLDVIPSGMNAPFRLKLK